MGELRDCCRHCGLPEDEHHYFEPYSIPYGCKCDPEDWGDPGNIPYVCEGFVLKSEWPGQCGRCEHLEECHVSAAASGGKETST